MISRKTTKTLAYLYNIKFSTGSELYGLKRDELYDFLFERNYETWFLNLVKSFRTNKPREATEFILRLHTGETVSSGTPNWSWDQRKKLGQRLLFNLSEDILNNIFVEGAFLRSAGKRYVDNLKSELELDGYLFRDGKLYFSEAAVLDTDTEQGILGKLIEELQLENQDIMNQNLELSETHYTDNNWGDSIINSRKYLESVLKEIAAKHHYLTKNKKISSSIYSSPVKVRDYLETNEFLEPKEKKALSGIYGLLSETGAHPYMAEKEQARLLRYMALTFAQFALLRFQGSDLPPIIVPVAMLHQHAEVVK